MWTLYRLVTLLLGPAWLLYLKALHGGALLGRLGLWPRREDRPVWIQAVSVGEVRIASRLASRLREMGIPVVISSTTATGLALARGQGEEPLPFPADLPTVMARVLRRLNPRAVVLVETELWPGLLRAAESRNIPVVVVNGRLSDRSLGRSLRFAGAFGRGLEALFVAAQSKEHASRFERLGVPAGQVAITGNLKYELQTPPSFEAKRLELAALCGSNGPIWVVGSVREGEEAAVLRAHHSLRESIPAARLILAPRHLNRVGLCLEEAKSFGFLGIQKTLAAGGVPWDVLILDTMGDLQSAYACGQVVFVGGSLVPLGGQNMLEPAALGLPVLFGPSTENFREEAERLLASGGAIRVGSARDLADRLAELLGDPAKANAMGSKAKSGVSAYRGALTRTLEFLNRLPQMNSVR